jgi:hypothetical protein
VLTKDEMKRKEEPGKKNWPDLSMYWADSCGDQFGPLYDAEAKISQADSSSYRNLNSQSGKLKK